MLFQIGGSLPFLVVGAVLLGQAAPARDATWLAWAGVAYQAVVVAFASYLVWFWLLLRYPAARISGFTFLTPIFGVLSGGLFLGEPLSASLLVGLAAIAFGLRLVNRPRSA
jgi:drug/metabolite transporter (DMT)-like permease